MYQQGNTTLESQCILLFAHIIDCTIVVKTETFYLTMVMKWSANDDLSIIDTWIVQLSSYNRRFFKNNA